MAGYKTILNNGKLFLNSGGLIYLSKFIPSGETNGYFLIDLGQSSELTSRNWNNIYAPDNLSITLIDTSGETSNIKFITLSSSYGVGEVGTTSSLYPYSATRDVFFNMNSGTTDIYRISGLTNSKIYDIHLYHVNKSIYQHDKSIYRIVDNNGTVEYYLDNQSADVNSKIISPDRVPKNGIIDIELTPSGNTSFAGLAVVEIIEKTPVTYDSSSIQNIKVVFNTIPTSTSVTKAKLKYDKKLALSYIWDDNMADQYGYGFKYLNGGVADDGSYSSGKTYTDGCGNKIKFKVSTSVFSGQGGNTDVHTPVFIANYMLWSQIKEVYDAGWGVTNHGYIDGSAADNYQVERNRSFIYLQASGTTTKVFAEPNSQVGFENYVWDITGTTKYSTYLNQSMWQAFGNAAGGLVDAGDLTSGSNRISYASWPVHDFHMYRTNGFSSSDVITACNDLSGATSNWLYHSWKSLITHSVAGHGGGYGSFADFKTAMDYIEDNYGSDGLDICLVDSDQSIYEYLVTRDVTIINQSLNNNVLDITFSWNNTYSGDTLPNDMRNYDLTLKVSGNTSISDIIINGGTGCTYNKNYSTNTGLINLKWNGGLSETTRLLNTATERVVIAELTTTANDKAIAQDYVSSMSSGTDKTNLQNRLNAI